jgi:hypothetical protein
MSDTSGKRVQIVDGVEYRYGATWTKKLEDEYHWRLYWNQVNILTGLVQPGDKLLEIGPGTRFTTNYLTSKGYNVTTLDIDDDKNPDIVANLVTYPFEDQYDAILAFEVFEHVPYERFAEVFPRIARASRKAVVFSVPQCRRTPFYFEVKLPKCKPFRWQWNQRRGKVGSPRHFWEIDYKDTTRDTILKLIADAGLRVERSRTAFDRVFFACVPRQNA